MRFSKWARAAMWVLAAFIVVACGGPATGGPDIQVEDAWTRPSPLAGGNGAIYMQLNNRGGSADRLLGASTAAARVAEFHQVTMEGDVMHMHPVEGGTIEVPAGESVALEPGGLHIMMIDLNLLLEAGNTITLVLEFEQSGTQAVTVAVRDDR